MFGRSFKKYPFETFYIHILEGNCLKYKNIK